ncbi:MAG: type II CRISPR-associated endonuclease Cas1 [Prevotella sp.]|nr:type II CRISPR-associated endonuclease Cas1 [Bacteroidales bacterium]MDY6027856.1 type II CRISPR-associated endonuclease Cas1 [Prevotella sp.]
MLKRTLVFSNPMTLSLKNCQLVLAYKDDPDNKVTIPIEDIGVVIIEHQQVSITIPLMNALVEGNVQVVMCNNRGMPSAMLQSFEGNNLQGENLRNQMGAGEVLKKQLWKQIVEAKIRNQAALLNKVGQEGDRLKQYYQNVKSGDADNREGIAARIYFSELFGESFLRDRTVPGINALLNYGYAILRAATARALVSSGLLPAIGIFHHNRSNAFPLADDVMEPYRPYVDEIVYDMAMQAKLDLTKDVKAELINVLYADTQFSRVTRPLSVGLTLTTASLSKCFAKEQTKLSLPFMS